MHGRHGGGFGENPPISKLSDLKEENGGADSLDEPISGQL
jgi:hypothetical protein